MTKRIAIYTRVSKDRHGDERSPTRQEADCRAFSVIREWSVEATFRDVDLSAYQPGVKRPGYEALLEAIREHRVDGVVVWKLDRLVRRPSEFERFWAACERARVLLASVTEPIDTSNELGLAIVRILVTFAGLESSTKSLRLKSAARAAAYAGERHRAARAYGYAPDRSTIVPAEAAVIREGASRVLAGESLASVARDFTARGIPRARSTGAWTGHGLRNLLNHAGLAGWREYAGEIVAKGSWPPILDEDTSARLRLLFADPSRRLRPEPRIPALLRGFLRCGRCGRNLYTSGDGRAPRRANYRCQSPPHGCNGIFILRRLIDDLVATAAVEHLAWLQQQARKRAPGPRAARTADSPELTERRRVALKAAAHDHYVARVIDRDEYLTVRDELIGDGGAPQRPETLSWRGCDLLDWAGKRSLVAEWERMDVPQRREVLAAILDHVVVYPAPRDSRFHPERVKIIWIT
jgi:DNA invertase Pin-like site-specific DNA recombinase